MIFTVLVSILAYFFFKPIAIHFLDKSLSKSLKYETTISSLKLYPLEINATIHMDTFPEGIKVHAIHNGKISLSPRSIGEVIITSTSLGGLVQINYEHYIYNIQAKNVDFKKVALVLADKKIVQSGLVNGTITYHKKKREGHTDLKVTKVTLNIPDVDKTISSVQDALNLDVMKLFSRNFSQRNKNKKQTTEVDHFQFNISLKNENITANDVALRTDTYRVSLSAYLHKKGKIHHLSAHLIDKNGCSIVKQDMFGNIKKPKRKTSTAIKNIATSTPKSFFGMGQNMMRYGSNYASQQTGMNGPNIQMTSYMLKESDFLFKNSANIILPKGCKSVYSGVVKHPIPKRITPRRPSKSYRL